LVAERDVEIIGPAWCKVLAIDDQCSRRAVIERGNAKNCVIRRVCRASRQTE
jgi:hypothetical protein